jgi:hypothetical protein
VRIENYQQPQWPRATISGAFRIAARTRARWRALGFDLVRSAPSGFCWPVNSKASTDSLPGGYRTLPIDSEAAVAAIAAAVASGFSYRV